VQIFSQRFVQVDVLIFATIALSAQAVTFSNPEGQLQLSGQPVDCQCDTNQFAWCSTQKSRLGLWRLLLPDRRLVNGNTSSKS
jgi:hypothetical protein